MIRIENYDLGAHNTFGMKVKCALYIEYESVAELQGLDLKALPQPVFHIGAGSNLLFTRDFPGTVLHSGVKFLKYVDMGLDEVLLTVGSGVVFDDFVAEVCKQGLWGAENLSLIPGEVGASAVQNIGAYGVEVKDIIAGVVCMSTEDGSKTVFKTPELAYGYRDSFFKHNRGKYIVTSVLFRLTRKYSPKLEYGNIKAALEAEGWKVSDKGATRIGEDGRQRALTPQDVRDAIIGIRRAKLPDPVEIGSAGSFFKNPVVSREHFERIVASVAEEAASSGSEAPAVPHYDLPDGSVKIPAAWMIDRLGFRGQRLGGAQVYEKQPLVLVNADGSATPEDIIALETKIIEGVEQRFGIHLSPEVDHI